MLLTVVAACGGAPLVVCADAGTTLTYSGFGQPFMSKYCVSCHGSSKQEKGIRLDTQAEVARWKDQTVSHAGTGTDMPPSDALLPSTEERAELADWLSCGGP